MYIYVVRNKRQNSCEGKDMVLQHLLVYTRITFLSDAYHIDVLKEKICWGNLDHN